jgi:hypothetical protein
VDRVDRLGQLTDTPFSCKSDTLRGLKTQ